MTTSMRKTRFAKIDESMEFWDEHARLLRVGRALPSKSALTLTYRLLDERERFREKKNAQKINSPATERSRADRPLRRTERAYTTVRNARTGERVVRGGRGRREEGRQQAINASFSFRTEASWSLTHSLPNLWPRGLCARILHLRTQIAKL